ncbi:MAG TPA: pilus assembly protein PilM, partial [Thiohalobacter sp.]|nr:pilus assembly protein PilM [Thiohalobacter sp.]
MALFSFLNHGGSGEQAGLLLRESGTSLARVNGTQAAPRLLDLAHLPGAGDGETLERLLQQHRPGRAAVHCVLPLGSYQLLLVDMPKVPANEIKAAVRWQIKDLIDFHVDDAVVDVFDAPPSGAGGAQEQVYAVVTRTGRVQHIAGAVQQAGLSLAVIDIPELALRNLAAHLPEQEQGVAVMYLEAERGLIALCRDNTLYLARTIELGRAALADADPDRRAMAISSLALEIQRSMDYYDRYFQQAPINHLYIAPTAETLPGLISELHGQVGLEARLLTPELIFADAEADPTVWAHSLLAVPRPRHHRGRTRRSGCRRVRILGRLEHGGGR